jgi:multiple sugar transport system substrate-binding protein/sorbitol/mannitol transport system substrate-binding protein
MDSSKKGNDMKRRQLLALTLALATSSALPAIAQNANQPYAGTHIAVLM